VQTVEVREGQKATLLAGLDEFGHRRARATVRRYRLASLFVLDEVERPEHAEASNLADAPMAARKRGETRTEHVSPIQAAFSTIPSSAMVLIVATAAAHASGWPEYVWPPA